MQYEACPYRVKLKVIDREPEPPQPANSPLERGNREHQRYEDFVKGKLASLSVCEAKSIDAFTGLFDHLKALYDAGMATAEEDWTLNADWDFCSKSEYWLWVKLDLSVQDEANRVVVVGDYKTGKSQYKAVEHVQQTQLYAAVAALKYEWADTIFTEMWYVDEGHVRQQSYTRDQALGFIGRFNRRADVMLSDKMFRPNPNKETCRYCPYSPRGTGKCPVGV